MAGETTSTNMGMPIPGVGVTAGPTWATDIVNCLNILDAHTHVLGNGVQITPSAININAALPFANNPISGLYSAGFTSQSGALTGTNFLSFVSGNLYVNDGSGNQIPITSGGGVAGSPGSIGGLASPAAATYTAGSKLFSWTADSGKSAAMDNGAVTIRETNVASARGVTLQSPGSLASDYSLTLPASLPASTQYLTSTSGGVLSFSSADAIAAAMTSTGANAVGSSMNSTGANAVGASMSATGANAVGSTMTSTGSNAVAASRTRATGTTVAAGGVAMSAASGNFSTTSATFIDVTNLTITITTSGRPIFIGLVANPSALTGEVYLGSTVTTGPNSPATSMIQLVRGSTTASEQRIDAAASASGTGSNPRVFIPVSSFSHIDAQAAGTYTYKIQAKTNPFCTVSVFGAVLVAYEL